MSAADLPFGTIVARGPEVLVKLMDPKVHTKPRSDETVDQLLRSGWVVERYGLGES